MMTESQESTEGLEIDRKDSNDINDTMPSSIKTEENANTCISKIELHSEFTSFIQLRDALERYQKENHVQLIVKDSKLLSAESTQRIIPKVYHLVNKNLMYHSITYCCKCHGELKQKPGTRIKNAGARRLNCPMYLRFKLSSDFQSLVLFDIYEIHNHGIDPTTFQLPPRQQVYSLSRLKRGQPVLEPDRSHKGPKELDLQNVDVHTMLAAAIKDVNSISSLSAWNYQPSSKSSRLDSSENISNTGEKQRNEPNSGGKDRDCTDDENEDGHKNERISEDDVLQEDDLCSPLDSESDCFDSDDEEYRAQQNLLPFPIRLIGSAIQSSQELKEAARQLIDLQRDNLHLEKRKLLLQTKQLELENAKLTLEVKTMEKNLESETSTPPSQDTTIYLQASLK